MPWFIYITVWSRRDGTHLVLTISPDYLREDILLRMYSIAPAGLDARHNTHWVKLEEEKSLTEVSAKYIGAIFVGRANGWANSGTMLLEWMEENGGANNIDIADWNNGQWVCNLVGAMSASEHEVVDTVLPESWLNARVLHDHIQQTHIPQLWTRAGWRNIIGLV